MRYNKIKNESFNYDDEMKKVISYDKRHDEDNYLYRVTDEGSYHVNNESYAGIFFANNLMDALNYGDLKNAHRYKLKENCKLYKDLSSYDYCLDNNLFDKEYKELKDVYKVSNLQYIEDNENLLFDNPNLMIFATQLVAKIELSKQNYDGAYWRYEDDLIPEQYQIWNLDCLIDTNEINLDESKEDKQRFINWAGEDLANKFYKIKDRLNGQEKDIYYWMKKNPNDLKNKLNDLDKIPTKNQKDKKAQEGANLIYSNDNWKIYEISTWEAAAKYGSNTRWCITSRSAYFYDCGFDPDYEYEFAEENLMNTLNSDDYSIEEWKQLISEEANSYYESMGDYYFNWYLTTNETNYFYFIIHDNGHKYCYYNTFNSGNEPLWDFEDDGYYSLDELKDKLPDEYEELKEIKNVLYALPNFIKLLGKFDNKELKESKEDQNKFKDWISQDNTIDVEDTYNLFNRLKQRLKSPYNDLYYWIKNSSPQALNKYLKELESMKSRKQKEADARSGAKLLYSDDEWDVLEINTYEASVKYGKNTQWCISGSKRWANNEEGGRKHWNSYKDENIKFYFYINKNDNKKYALALYPDNSTFELFNEQDNPIYNIPNAPKVKEIPVDVSVKDDFKIIMTAIAEHKVDDSIMFDIIEALGMDYDKEIRLTNKVSDFVNYLDGLIPDGFIEATYNNEEWYGDIPPIDNMYYFPGKTKDEICNVNNPLYKDKEYFLSYSYSDEYDVWIDMEKSYSELLYFIADVLDFDNWYGDYTDDDYEEEFKEYNINVENLTNIQILLIRCAESLKFMVVNGKYSTSLLKDLGVSKEYIDDLKQHYGID